MGVTDIKHVNANGQTVYGNPQLPMASIEPKAVR